MKGYISCLLTAAYGIAWAWTPRHPYHAFFFLLFVGLLTSAGVMAEGIVKALPLMLLGIAFSVLTSLFPLLAIFETLFLVYMAYRKRQIYQSYFFLLATGILFYSILFYAPRHLEQSLPQYLKNAPATWLLFSIGVLLMTAFCYILQRLGYDRRKTAMYILGFPGIIFLLWFSWREFPARGIRRI